MTRPLNDVGMMNPKLVRAEEGARIAELEAVLKKREEGRMAPVTVEGEQCPVILSSYDLMDTPSNSPSASTEGLKASSILSTPSLVPTSSAGRENAFVVSPGESTGSALEVISGPSDSASAIAPLPKSFDADASGPMDGSAMGWVSREEVELGRFRKLQAYREKRRKECVTKLNAVFGVRRFSIIAGALGVVKKATLRMVGG